MKKPAVQKKHPTAVSSQKSAATVKKPALKTARTAASAPVGAVQDESRAVFDLITYEPGLPDDPVWQEALLHGRRVERLACALFRDLAALHGLGAAWEERLRLAARLHDIGFAAMGRKAHHKNSMRLIEADPALVPDEAERPLVALLARYHRRAWPSLRHKRFAGLPREEQKGVRRMAALLRLADALDYTHQGLVEEVSAIMDKKRVQLILRVRTACLEEMRRAEKKGDLFEAEFGKRLSFSCLPL